MDSLPFSGIQKVIPNRGRSIRIFSSSNDINHDAVDFPDPEKQREIELLF